MQRPGFFTALAVVVAAVMLARLVRRGPLLGARARALAPWEVGLFSVSLTLLVFHCAAMFAPGAVAWLGLDTPAATARDLQNPVGQVAYWVPGVTLVAALRRMWWPAPLGVFAAVIAVGWTMYGGFTLNEHLVAIAVAVLGLAVVLAGLVRLPQRRGSGGGTLQAPAGQAA